MWERWSYKQNQIIELSSWISKASMYEWIFLVYKKIDCVFVVKVEILTLWRNDTMDHLWDMMTTHAPNPSWEWVFTNIISKIKSSTLKLP